MNNGIYEKYHQMSISQLKEEYYKCNDDNKKDKVKKQMIGKIIKNKIDDENKLNQQLQQETNKYLDVIIQSKHKKELMNKQKLIEKRGPMESCWDSIQSIDPKFKSELEQDYTNNKLMERLNSELDFRINETKNKDVMRPYSSQDEGNYIDYNKNQKKTQPSTNFSSKRMIH